MRMNRTTKTTIVAYMCLAPAILGLLILYVIPIIGVTVMSFTEWTGLKPPEFIGFANYKSIFTEDFYFGQSVLVTIYFALSSVIGGIVYSFAVAMMLTRNIPARGFWRSVYFIPFVVPAIAANVVWSWIYDSNFGVLNYLRNLVGLNKSLFIMGEKTAIPSLALIVIWGTGNLIVIFLAGLQNVPKTYLEAVEIDGGNAWHKFRNVTIPMMTPIIFFNFLMSTIMNLQVFIPAFALTKGGPNNHTLFWAYYIYREGFMRNNFGYASALSLLFFIFVALITALIFRTSNKWLFYEGE